MMSIVTNLWKDNNYSYNECCVQHSFFDIASLKYALANLKNNKATGVDSIPAECLKNGGKALHAVLLQLSMWHLNS